MRTDPASPPASSRPARAPAAAATRSSSARTGPHPRPHVPALTHGPDTVRLVPTRAGAEAAVACSLWTLQTGRRRRPLSHRSPASCAVQSASYVSTRMYVMHSALETAVSRRRSRPSRRLQALLHRLRRSRVRGRVVATQERFRPEAAGRGDRLGLRPACGHGSGTCALLTRRRQQQRTSAAAAAPPLSLLRHCPPPPIRHCGRVLLR